MKIVTEWLSEVYKMNLLFFNIEKLLFAMMNKLLFKFYVSISKNVEKSKAVDQYYQTPKSSETAKLLEFFYTYTVSSV